MKISLCNIYAPNNQPEQVEFIQELNSCIIDKSEMTNIIIGGLGDWNCANKKRQKRRSTLETYTTEKFAIDYYGNF